MAVVSVSVSLGNNNGRLTSHSIACWLAWPDHGLHAWLHHTWLHHTGLHHSGLLHAGLHHAGLHHAGLLHAGLHHAGLHHARLHAWLHHTWLHHTRLHTWLHHAWLHHTWLHAWLHHARLHHTWLHAWLHHSWLHHTWLHARLHHSWLHHTWLHARLHHAWLHHLLLTCCATLACNALTCWLPDSLDMNLTGRFTLVLNRKPVIDSGSNTEGGKFDISLANFVIGTGILIEALNRQVVSNVLHIDVKGLVPNGRLTSSILDSSLEVLLAR